MAVNLNMKGSEEGNINQYLSDTIGSVFKNVYTIDVAGCTNRALYAFNSGETLDRFRKGIAAETDVDLTGLMEKILNGMQLYEAGNLVMTDDKAPVELLGMRVIDSLIRDEVEYYRGIYEREGVEGLLKGL